MNMSGNYFKNIVACGDSVTHGYYLENDYHDETHIVKSNQGYPEIVAETLGASIVNLSKPGASNYCIAKQLDYAFTLQPDFIIIGLTTGMRFDYTTDIFADKHWKDNIPTIQDFDYRNHSRSEHTNNHGLIESQPLSSIETYHDRKDLVNYIAKYIDIDIKRDQDRHIIMGMLWKLAVKKIPYVIVDWTEMILYEYTSRAVIRDLKLSEYRNLYPCADGVHFNQEGHRAAAARINRFITAFFQLNKLKI